MIKSIFALFALALLVAAAAPAEARYYRDGWYARHHTRYHHRWHRYGYAPAVSDYYHRSRQLVGTR